MSPSGAADQKQSAFDARLFEPPSWATQPPHARVVEAGQGLAPSADSIAVGRSLEDDEKSVLSETELGVERDENTGEARLTTLELRTLLKKAEDFKEKGNRHFMSKPPKLDDARQCYLSALDLLPQESPAAQPSAVPSGISEITDSEADELQASSSREGVERQQIQGRIRDCSKAVWGNLGAVYTMTGDDKEAVKACTNAIELDPTYGKALQRRAKANEQIGSWSSLSDALEDHRRLITLLPPGTPHWAASKRSIADLPGRITHQQEKEKDEMLGKLKELGNGLLGKFGLSTDMFHFDQQPGGGYNVRFQK